MEKKKMIDYKKAVSYLEKSDSKINSIAIIKDFDNIVYQSENWDISRDLEHIRENWGAEGVKSIIIDGKEYKILQNTPERLIAAIFREKTEEEIRKDKQNREVINTVQKGIVGFRDNNGMILSKIESDGQLNTGLIDTARALKLMSLDEPYMDPDEPLGKELPKNEVSTTFLLDTLRVLQRMGLKKFGLSQDDALVYLALLRRGEKGISVGKLDKELPLKRTHIYRIIERLEKKNWVEESISPKKSTKIFVARPISELVNKIIEEKEEEIKVLKSFRLIMSEYFSKEWDGISRDYRDSQSFGKEIFDIDVLGIMGLEKDFGIIVFEYEGIKIDNIRVRDKIDLVYGKIKKQIKKLRLEKKIVDLEDIKIEHTEIHNYLGANIFLKFKQGSKITKDVGEGWIASIKQVAIPIDNKIYVIWGSEEKFEMVLNIILKLK